MRGLFREENPQNGYRNGPLYPSYVAAAFANLFA